MANRVLQQKRFKMKRMRRAYLKSFNVRNSGPNNLEGIGFGSRTKAAQTTFDAHLLAKMRFNPNSNEAIYAKTQGLHTDIWPGGQEVVLARRVRSRANAGSLQKDQRYVHAVMRKETNLELRLYMLGDSCFFAMEMLTKTERIYKMSAEYNSKDRAVESLKHNRIVWENVERVPLDSLPSADPVPASG